MADSGTPKCGTCDTPVVAATDPCTTETECTQPVTPCEEDHTQTICTKEFATAVKVLNSFNFPAVGEFATLQLEGVKSLVVGSFLWNPTVGRLYVQSFDAEASTAVVVNRGDSCDEGGKTAGDAVPACVEFSLGVPECNTGGGGNNSNVLPYLAADFIGPAVDACQLASVTTVTGISVNDIVSVNTFLYRVKSIPDANTLELCNEGDGAPTGQVIEFDPNCDDIPDVQVISVTSDDPCSREGGNTGKILVCKDGVAQPLVGTEDSQIPVWDKNLEEFVLKTVSIPESCTALSACLVVDVGDDGPYIAVVNNANFFVVGNRVVIDDDVFVVDAIVDATHLRLIPDVTPPAIKEYAIGETVCIQDCCVDLPDRVNTIEETLADPCFDKRLLPPNRIEFSRSNLTFQPTDQGGGVFQQHYDIGDIALGGDLFSEQLVLPDDGCTYYVEATVYMTITSLATGPDAAMDNLSQFHDFVLAVDGDYSPNKQRAVHYSRGVGNDVLDFVSNVPPVNFLLNGYQWMPRSTVSIYAEKTVNAANGIVNSPVFSLGHRLSLGDTRNIPNWVNPLNRLEWLIDGHVIIKAHKRKDIP